MSEKVSLHLRTQGRGDENYPSQHFLFGRNEEESNGLGESYTRCSGIPIFVPRSRTCPDVSLLVDVRIILVFTLVFK